MEVFRCRQVRTGRRRRRERRAPAPPEVTVVVITLGRESLLPPGPRIVVAGDDLAFETLLIANGPVDEATAALQGCAWSGRSGPGGTPTTATGALRKAGGYRRLRDDGRGAVDDGWLERLAEPIVAGREEAAPAGPVNPWGRGSWRTSSALLGFCPAEAPWAGRTSGRWTRRATPPDWHLNCAAGRSCWSRWGASRERGLRPARNVYISEGCWRGGRASIRPRRPRDHGARTGLGTFLRWQARRGEDHPRAQDVDLVRAAALRPGSAGRHHPPPDLATARFLPMLDCLLSNRPASLRLSRRIPGEASGGRARG